MVGIVRFKTFDDGFEINFHPHIHQMFTRTPLASITQAYERSIEHTAHYGAR
jgi:hypothetical protein